MRPGMISRALAFAVLVATPLCVRAQALVDPLARMYSSIRELDFQGSFVYARNAQVEALRIFHAGGMLERERLIGLNGARTEISRENGTVTCSLGSAPSMLFHDPAARLLPLLPDLRGGVSSRLYTVVVGGDDRVAGYKAQRIDVVPSDAYRYGYRIWLEDQSGFPLRSAVVDASQRTLEEFMFVSLDIGTRPRESDLAPGAGTSIVAEPDEAPESVARWKVADLPPGFVLLRSQRAAQGGDATEHQVYTDGVASVSVYIEPRTQANAVDRGFNRGMLNIYTHESAQWRIAALGDVPRATLERMVRSVQPAAATR
jgi:sigma-E factor negative regulatory protein RseB